MKIRNTPRFLFEKYPSIMKRKTEKYELYEGERIIARRGTVKELKEIMKRI